jgi:transposase
MTPVAQGANVTVTARCANCGGSVELECEPLPLYQGYQTFNEYTCPHCHKHDVHRTSGAIVEARKPVSIG